METLVIMRRTECLQLPDSAEQSENPELLAGNSRKVVTKDQSGNALFWKENNSLKMAQFSLRSEDRYNGSQVRAATEEKS